MKDVQTVADYFIKYAAENLELDESNKIYIKNNLIEILQSAEDELSEEAKDRVYGAISLLPAEINKKFARLLNESSKEATDWFYSYCVRNDYVKRALLDRNPRFESDGLIITINKAKPEFRDPKKAVSGNSVAGGYPLCSICRENEGYGGRNKRTLRTADITLGGEKWFWQYSPYGYFNEHGIAVNCVHTPMKVDRSTFVKLLDFVDIFPHYFIGCNAPLPRIGGSVLAHDHFQGGGEVLPLHRAKALYTLHNKSYPHTVCEIPDWKGTVIRLVSESRDEIVEQSEIIRKAWVSYSNEELGIIAEDKDGFHNAISPTVLKTGRGYEMNIILRSNITNKEYPDGVFHAHPEFHSIKKESIGLIEAQGLFILPGRLESELVALEGFIERGEELPREYLQFGLIYDETKRIYDADKQKGVHEAIEAELGSICGRILENTAVFKEKGQLIEFVKKLGFTL